MATKSLRYESLPSAAISEGATTPDPGLSGVRVWSTTLSKVMVWDGSKWVGFQDSIAVGTTAPTSPYIGQLWLDTTP